MANYKNIILVLQVIILSLAHLESVRASADFEFCGLGDITSKDGSFFFNISVVKSRGEIECRRLIHVDEGYVKLTINTSGSFFQNALQVFDGGFDARKLVLEDPKGQGTYETTGNTMAILLKAENTLESSENSVLRGTYISLPFQTTCECRGIQNGIERCWESLGERKCEATCKNGFVDLTESTGNFSCNLLSGKWDKGLEMSGFGCQSTILPSVVVQLNLTFSNAHLCTDSTKENISTLIQNYFKDNKIISANGQCFGQNNGNCTVIDCVEKNNSSFVSVTIEDKANTKSQSVKENARKSDLFNVYNSTSFKGIEEQLFALINNTLKNTSLLNKVQNSVNRQCPTGMFLFLAAGDIGHPVCSKCPAGSFYSAFRCEKCPNGSFSLEGSETCSLKESQKISPSSKDSCKIYCPMGKGLNLKAGFCQWCPYNTYQNRTDVPNVNCSACPEGKRTPYPGATGIDQCYVPCQIGTFFTLKDQQCLSCPLGTYQEEGKHLYMRCKNCGQGKVTYSIGSTDPAQCVPSCAKGRYLDSKTSQCLKCPFGSYQSKINQLNCTRCPDGLSTLKNGSSDQSDCFIMCLMGTYFDAQKRYCAECPKGTYMDQNGHFASSCIKCTGNKTTPGHSSVKESRCLDKCDSGEYFNTQNHSCSKCPLGTYMDQKGHLLFSCIQCNGTKTTHVQGAGHANYCLLRCGPGHFFVAENRSCSKCPSGTYMDKNNHFMTSCEECGADKTTRDKGTVNKTQCFDKCKTGEYFSVENSSCELCPFGAYMDQSGHLITSCKKCSEKKTTYDKGAVNDNQCKDECSVGNYFNSTTLSCVACPKGSYQSKTAQKTCLSCPPGMNTRSSGETSKLACVKFMCGPGEFIKSTGECELCPTGTYQSAVNHTLSSCQQCPSKMSNVQGATNLSSCKNICDSFPCDNGAECIEKADAFCKCPRGLTGKRCEIFENKEELLTLEIAVRFTSMDWIEAMGDKTSGKYRKTKYRIENSLRKVLTNDESFVGVKVNELMKGSVIANFDLYMNDNASVVPAKTLQIAVKHGSIGGLPVDAEYLSIKQVTCNQALGMEKRRIKDENITASSESEGQEAKLGRLNSAKGWLAKEVKSQNYIQVGFYRNMSITAIATQGDAVSSFVTAYTLSYSKDEKVWMNVKESVNSSLAKNFTGNNDTNTIIKNILPQPITLVKYIRVIPVTWSNGIGMRIEFYGCISNPFLPPEEIPTKGPEEPPPQTTEPNVEAVASKKDDYSWGKYLGITFGLLMVIGCLIAFFMWWRSARRKQQREKTPLVMTKLQGSEYTRVDKNDDLEYDEATV